MTVSARGLRAAAALLLLAGCSGGKGEFSATLTGPVEGTFQGNATFCRRPDGGVALLLEAPKSTAGFLMERAPAGPLLPGPYGVADTLAASGALFRFQTLLAGVKEAAGYEYRVRSGEVRVLSADSNSIRGRFRVESLAVDPNPQIDAERNTIRRLPTAVTTLMGSFRAVRVETCTGRLKQRG